MSISRRTFLATPAASLVFAAQTSQPPRLRRKDSFFGFHFDLHPNARDTDLGRDVTEEMVEQFLAQTKPDYVQYDYKGHVGYIGYPSNVSASAPNVKNSIEIWRKVTAPRGVALYIPFSAVIDGVAVTDHPEWARVGPDGARDTQANRQATSTFGPYVDERMIPQLKEAIEKYDVDGVWVDGDCWGAEPDYSPAAARAWREASGMEALPRRAGDPGWQQFLEFNREQFRKYLRHYVAVLHEFRPSFEICSNRFYTTFAPERPEIPVDFASCDSNVSWARLETRYMASGGKTWDWMDWGAVGGNHKPSAQINQEGSLALAQGGGFQVYYQPTRAGKLDDHLIATMTKIASFCRARQALSFKSETVPQIGLVFSRDSLYDYTPPAPAATRAGASAPPANEEGNLFYPKGRMMDPPRGLLDALLECHYSVDVVPDWKLSEVASQYPLLAVPAWLNIGADVKNALAGYAGNGGNLLLVGAANAALFSKELGVRLRDASLQPAFITGEETFGNARGLWQDVDPGAAEAIESRYPVFDASRDAQCAATLSKFGSGRIAAIYGPLGSVFAVSHAAPVRQFIRRVVDRVFTPMAQVDAASQVETVLRRKDGKLLLPLINCSGSGMEAATAYATEDVVPAAGPVRIALRTPKRPARVTLEPGAREI